MSLQARVNGFTAWVNMRLSSKGFPIENVLTDMTKGIHLKTLLEEITGKPLRRLQSMDNLSPSQKQLRFDWFVGELKQRGHLPSGYRTDTKLLAVLKADEVFDLFWQIVKQDVIHVWEESEFLQLDDSIIIAEPFQLRSDPRLEEKQKSPTPLTKQSVQKSRRAWTKKPSAESCILQLVQDHLKLIKECRRISIESLYDLVSSRVLCGLLNSFAPGTFTSEVLLDDRWTINLVLKCAEDLFRFPSGLDSGNLMEADLKAIGSYMCSFFTLGYQFKQARAAANRHHKLVSLIASAERELDQFPDVVQSMSDMRKKKDLVKKRDQWNEELGWIEMNYDVPAACEWMRHADQVQTETRSRVAEKIHHRFDVLKIPRSMTINDLVDALGINLSLTCGRGFFTTAGKETIWAGRKVVLRDVNTGEFFDDFSGSVVKKSVWSMLGAKSFEVLNVSHFQDKFEIFFESQSRNRMLKAGSKFLYQVFPGSNLQCQRLLFTAAKTGDLETAQKLVVFFQCAKSFLHSREQASGNCALHLASRHGHLEIVQYLLECGADIDLRNHFGSSALFLAVESLHRPVCQLLIEWNANIEIKNRNSKTAFDLLRNEEMKRYLLEKHRGYKRLISGLKKCDHKMLLDALDNHAQGKNTFVNLQSRCIAGDTLAHVAASMGNIDALDVLLREQVDFNALNSNGATPLHVAKDSSTIKLLLCAGVNIDAIDDVGDTTLHRRCVGKRGLDTDIDSIEALLRKGACMTERNNQKFMPIHCCAQHGRVDAMRVLLDWDAQGKIRLCLEGESETEPPSLMYLALANDYFACASWLMTQNFSFKPDESDQILKSLLIEEIKSSVPGNAVQFLIDNGATCDALDDEKNTALHLAIEHNCSPDVVRALLAAHADVNAANARSQTPLFVATKNSQIYSASLLLDAGADFRWKDSQGLCAFDLISDFDEWISSGYFTEKMRLRMQAHSLKQSRDLVRAISKKVQHTRQIPTSISGGVLPVLPLSPVRSFATLATVKTSESSKKERQSDSSILLPSLATEKVSAIQSVIFKNQN
ncbi:uncharacterized protein [Oscarella lobularis]|uniref:uncharacterized protein isoform X2 n=1 Tax=Oscarella lobularis TaxID=121494 RepID=UPI0033135E0B